MAGRFVLGLAGRDRGIRLVVNGTAAPRARSARPGAARAASTVIAAVALIVGACGTQPASQMDLTGTTWSIVTVDEDNLSPPYATMEFARDSAHAILSLRCGAVQYDWALETDSSGIAFLNPHEDPECLANSDQTDAKVRDAIEGTEEWSVRGSGRIVLDGSHRIVLVRTAS